MKSRPVRDGKFLDKVLAKWAKEDTPLDTLIVAKLLLKGHSCNDCVSKLLSSSYKYCVHNDGLIEYELLLRSRPVCALWGKYKP